MNKIVTLAMWTFRYEDFFLGLQDYLFKKMERGFPSQQNDIRKFSWPLVIQDLNEKGEQITEI